MLILRPFRSGPTLAAFASLTLGFGAVLTTGALVGDLLRGALPLPDADRLVRVRTRVNDTAHGVSWADHLDAVASAESFSATTFFAPSWLANVDFDGETETLDGVLSTASFFSVLGVEPELGRSFLPEDEAPEAPLVAVLGHDLWQRRFGQDPAVLGQVLSIGGDPFTVVGVAPPGFDYPRKAELWTVGTRFFRPEKRAFRIDESLGRLAENHTLQDARSELALATRRAETAHPETDKGLRYVATPEAELWTAGLRPSLSLLVGGASFLFLVAVANGTVARWTSRRERRREMALREALGCTWNHRIRGFLTEDLTLSFAALGAGMLLALWSLDASSSILLDQIPAWLRPQLKLGDLLLGVCLALATSLLLTLFTKNAVGGGRISGFTLQGDPGEGRTRDILITVALAGASLLTFAAFSFERDLAALGRIDPGFEVSGVVVLEGSFSYRKGFTSADRQRVYDAVVERLRHIPGVVAVGGSSDLPLAGQETWDRIEVAIPGSGSPWTTDFQVVDHGFAEALGLRLLAGGWFGERDDDVPRSAVIGARLARALGSNPIGRQILVGGEGGVLHRVIGIVEDVRHHGPTRSTGLALYVPARPPLKEMHLVVRVDGLDPASIAPSLRRAATRISPDFGIADIEPLSALLRRSVTGPRAARTAFGIFALGSTTLALLGVFALLDHRVRSRRRELAVRSALGARPICLRAGLTGQATLLSILGTGLGLIGWAAVSRWIGSLLHGTSPLEWATLVPPILALLGAAALAASIPSTRAARADPAEVLREE